MHKYINFFKYYFVFVLSCIVIGLWLSSIFSSKFSQESISLGNDFVITVLKANFLNFMSYLFFPFISPILQAIDLIKTVFDIGVSCSKIGLLLTIKKLVPHGLLEIPNILFYQGASQFILYILVKYRSVRKVFQMEKKLLKAYFLSLIILVVSALIEGWWG